MIRRNIDHASVISLLIAGALVLALCFAAYIATPLALSAGVP